MKAEEFRPTGIVVRVKNRLVPVFVGCALFLLLPGCEKNITPVSLTKDPAKLSWRADTLSYPKSSQTMMRAIWGSSPQNVYVVGHNSRPGPGSMYKYNGKNWSTTGFHIIEGGGVKGSVDFSEIFSFSPNNIWCVGQYINYNPNPPPDLIDSSLIVHFNGSSWSELPLEKHRRLNTIWGSKPDNIWAGGLLGSLYHYNGHGWERDSLDYPFPDYRIFQILSITGNSADNMYMSVHIDLVERLEYYYLFRYKNKQWVAIDSTRYLIDSITDLWMSPTGKLYAAGNALRKWEGSSWSVQIDPGSVIGLYGLSDDNIFAAVKTFEGGVIYHYNGKEWRRLEQTLRPGVMFTDIWTDGEEVFVVGYTIGSSSFLTKTIILHGK